MLERKMGFLVLGMLVVAAILIWNAAQQQNAAYIVPTPTPWGTPPWWPDGVRSLYVCPPADVDPGCESPRAITVVPEFLAEEIRDAGRAWEIDIAQVIRCEDTMCTKVLTTDRRGNYFLAEWFPAGHERWPQGGWTFREIPVVRR